VIAGNLIEYARLNRKIRWCMMFPGIVGAVILMLRLVFICLGSAVDRSFTVWSTIEMLLWLLWVLFGIWFWQATRQPRDQTYVTTEGKENG
jgi:Ca2+/Na+ antiporter